MNKREKKITLKMKIGYYLNLLLLLVVVVVLLVLFKLLSPKTMKLLGSTKSKK